MSVIYTPRGEAKEYASLAINIYKGCVHGCRYCYGANISEKAACIYFMGANPKKNIIPRIENDAMKLSGQSNIPEIQLSFLGDVYQPAEMDLGLTRQAIEILIKYGLPFTILTKGGTRAMRDFDLLEKYDRASFGSSIVFTSQEDANRWEPGVPSITDRLMALQAAHMRGIKTWVSLEPVIDPKQALDIIECYHPFVDHWKIGKLNHHAEIERKINWVMFRENVKGLLDRIGADYYIKNILKRL